MGKGFVIAIDALLSLVVLFVILSLAFETVQLNGGEWEIRRSLSVTAHFAASTLEQSSLLSRAVLTDNTTGIRTFLNGFPTSLCGSVSAFPSPDSNEAVFSVSKSGCSTSIGEQETVTRGFMVQSPPDVNLYVAKVTLWVNE